MQNFITKIPGFRTNTKSKIIVALMYYGYCIYSIPSRSIVSSVIWFALPFIFFAIDAKNTEKKKAEAIRTGKIVDPIKPTEPNKPIVLTKSLNIKIIAGIVVLLGFGMYSNSVQKKKDLQYTIEQKAIAASKAKSDAVAEQKAIASKKLADTIASENKRLADIQAVKDKKIADAQAKVVALAKAKADKVAYDTGITYDQLARTPDKYISKKIKFSGKVIQVMENGTDVQLRIAINDDYDNILLASYDSSTMSSRILENDEVNLKGLSLGVATYQSTMGGNITIPSVYVDSFY